MKIPKAANDNIDPNAPLTTRGRCGARISVRRDDSKWSSQGTNRGRLTTWMIAGKEYTTLNAIEEMLEKCRLQDNRPVSGSVLQEETAPRSGSSDNRRQHRTGCGPSEYERAERALEAYIAKKRVEAALPRSAPADQVFIADLTALLFICAPVGDGGSTREDAGPAVNPDRRKQGRQRPCHPHHGGIRLDE